MPHVKGPDEVYGDLFEVVQNGHIFPDSKTFVDATPNADVAAILQAFESLDRNDRIKVKAFVEEYFSIPATRDDVSEITDLPIARDRIEQLWNILAREADDVDPNSSLIGLPKPYIVPGGRFREVYYWDSYFTMLGLAESGRIDVIQNMVDNFAYLIDCVGSIPNGNRTYYCTRSQPPLFVLMVELLATHKQDTSIWMSYISHLEKEYDFWMAGLENLDSDLSAERRVVFANSGYLNRYWDDSDLPRQESHAEDVQLSANCDRDPAGLYRDVRSACESGWDFSTRWFADHKSLDTIRTSKIVPVDLNAIMYKLESSLAGAMREAGERERAEFFGHRALQRKQSIQELFFDSDEDFFVDLLLPDLTSTGSLTLAAAYPLFFGLATEEQAARVAERINEEFLKPGGWVTTLEDSGQQWDAPNGWAPLQWIVYRGLKRYGFDREANDGARRWVDNNLAVYRSNGRLLEKYNVEEVGLFAEGGEYEVQDGFGWTNGVLLSLMNDLDIE